MYFNMKIAVIILHFGNPEVTRNCIRSLRKMEKGKYSLIVVSNTKETYNQKDFFEKCIVINNKKNLGFARGVNVGIRYALKNNFDAVCLLNNDTCITKSFLLELSKNFSKKSVGIVGPAIHFRKKSKLLFDVGGKIDRLFLRTSHIEVEKIVKQNQMSVEYLSGCCMLIKKEVFKEIGLFDENFFLYYEDADFCLRARNAGFACVVDSSSVIKHELSKSAGSISSFTIYHLLRSGIYFGEKYAKTLSQKIANRLFILTQALLFFKANPPSGFAIAKALLSA